MRREHTPRLAVALLLALPFSTVAHEIPNDVTVQAFLKPEGRRLNLLVRVPLKAMRDMEFPQRGPSYLDLERAGDALHNAATLWISDAIALYEGEAQLAKPRVAASRVSLPSDRSFTAYEQALAHVTGGGLPSATDIYWDQALLDVLFEYPIQSDRSGFSIHAKLAPLGLRVITVLRFLPPSGVVRAYELEGDAGLIRLDPRWHQAASRFVWLGFLHIMEGIDHLLFLLCLVIPFRRFRSLVLVVTSFTVAHSITLIGSAYNLAPDALWFPPLIETLIATSIVYMALENIVGVKSVQRRWMITFAFGLVHGFGFSFALRQTLQFAGSHLLTSLLSFNVGVELGQLLVLLLLIPLLDVFFRSRITERAGTIILSVLVAHTGWHWMIDRGTLLTQFQFQWPAITAAFLAGAVRWLFLILVVTAIVWFLSELRRQRAAVTLDHPPTEAEPRSS